MLHTRDSNNLFFTKWHFIKQTLPSIEEKKITSMLWTATQESKERCIIPFHFTRLKILNHVGMDIYT